MWRFILLTFALLGVAFYELSGGSDFEAPERAAAAPVETAPLEIETAKVAQVTASDATRSKPALLSKPAPTPKVTLASVNVPTATRNPNQAFFAVVGNAPKRVDPEPSVTRTVVSEEPARDTIDLRIVSKPRVNMRGGPGTNHEVVAKLTRGEEVEVLQDRGDGWVKLRVADTGETGWMADFLLTAAN